MSLPIPISYAPMDARLVDDIPDDSIWQYEPKWDGFRCLAFRDGKKSRFNPRAANPSVDTFRRSSPPLNN